MSAAIYSRYQAAPMQTSLDVDQQVSSDEHTSEAPSQTPKIKRNIMTVPLQPPSIPTYYATGSLPRLNNRARAPVSRATTLSRANSVRNSWSAYKPANGIQLTLHSNGSSIQHSPNSVVSSIAPSDSVSVSNRQSNNLDSLSHRLPDARNKFNTLTPAEAKRLKVYLQCKQPTRTASVLHKPRAPPLVVTNHETPIQAKSSGCDTYAHSNGLPTDYQDKKQATSNNVRSSSSCSDHGYRDQRHSLNYGSTYVPNVQTKGIYNLSTNNGNNNDINSKNAIIQNSPNNSDSSLSFMSSLDVIDSAYGSDRLQTMSVDLGIPASQQYGTCSKNNFKHSQLQSSHQESKFCEESFASAKSHQSDSSRLKNSLSSSTSKVFQNQLSNIKKFFRYMPIRRSFMSHDSKRPVDSNQQNNYDIKQDKSLSQISINRSHSPPVCPPPPKELKSMSYMESGVNYSNYDDFTRARNHQTSTLLNGHSRNPQPSTDSNHVGVTSQTVDREDSSWQLASLPVAYERNLTTVFEEKHNSSDIDKNNIKKSSASYNVYSPHADGDQLIKPPRNFEDNGLANPSTKTDSSTSSSQSLASISGADVNLEIQRRIATSFRFSYAQPNSFENVS